MLSIDLRKMMHHIKAFVNAYDLENKRKGAIGRKGIVF